MSLFSWLFPARKPFNVPADSSGLSRIESTRPVNRRFAKEPPGSNAKPANRKGERMIQRELLYSVVRESMVNSGMLSASYKFKVLSLDARGHQFLVMVDLAHSNDGEIGRLAEIEALIAQSAKSRHDIVVTAVYWRTNEHVAIGEPSRVQPRESRPAALNPSPAVLESRAATLSSRSASSPHAAASHFDPIRSDEVSAFKRAMAAGAANPAAVAAAEVGIVHGAAARASDRSGKHGAQNYTLLTGFEDTEMPDAEQRVPLLSGTQWGDLN